MRRSVRLLAPLRHRQFRLLWTGMTVSLLGDGIFYVALPWQVYQLSDAPTALSVVGIAMAVPHIALLLLGGVVSDRFDRRRVMMAADILRGGAVGALGLLSLSGSLRLWHLIAMAAVFGAGTAFFGPAFDAIVPEIVPERQLTQANALDQFVRPAAWRMLGPAIGGWIVEVFGGRTGAAFVADAATFLASVICLALMHHTARESTRAEEPGDTDAESPWSQIREGFRYVRSQVWLWGTLVAATFAYLAFLGPTEVLLPYVVKYDLHAGAGTLGTILGLGGVGAMTAAFVMGNRTMPRRNMTFIYIVWTLSTLAVAGYGLARLPWQVMAACFVFNALEGAGTIVWATTKQRLVPNRLLGRVSSLDWFISIGLLPVSYALTGPLAAALGERTVLIGAGLVGASVTMAFLFLPGLRSIERDERLLDRADDVDALSAAGVRVWVP
jgi:MFS family permease